MANCVVCNNSVTRGFVLCPECARSFRSGEVPMDTIRFIDQLAEEIVCDTELPACSRPRKILCNRRGLTV